jgi:hypothetical protein
MKQSRKEHWHLEKSTSVEDMIWRLSRRYARKHDGQLDISAGRKYTIYLAPPWCSARDVAGEMQHQAKMRTLVWAILEDVIHASSITHLKLRQCVAPFSGQPARYVELL